jgi:hypothetical protein
MNLSLEEANLFFKLTWPLHSYVNQQRKILPAVNSLEAYVKVTQEDKLKVRNALYEHIDLIDRFVAQNPAGLSADELAIVQSWKKFISGRFYIFRFLKKAAIFIGPENKVYAVLGLHNGFDEMFYKGELPVMVNTVLLPFQGRVVYDGLMNIYRVTFGSGIRGDLNEIYMSARQKGQVIESLENGEQEPTSKRKAGKESKDWQPIMETIAQAAEKLKGADSAVQKQSFSLLKATIEMAQAAANDPENLNELWQGWDKISRSLKRLETTLHRAE